MASSKTKQSFELSEEDIKRAVSEFIEREYGAGAPLTVDVGVHTVTRGYGTNEHDAHEFSVTATREVVTK